MLLGKFLFTYNSYLGFVKSTCRTTQLLMLKLQHKGRRGRRIASSSRFAARLNSALGGCVSYIAFQVKGSADEPYVVTFTRRGPDFWASCTCQAGQSRQSCKHRLSILSNSAAGVVSSNTEEVAVVASWLPGSSVESAMAELSRTEIEQERAKRAVSAAKKALAAAMQPAP